MREVFVERTFNQKSTQLIDTINGILDEYVAAGYDLSLRQLYYQLVARDIVPNTSKSYDNIGALVSAARLAGLIDWDVIKDRGRITVGNPHWDTPADILDSAAGGFRIDLWETQMRYVMVMVEKQALEGVLIPVCTEMDVPFCANKGYSSSSMFYDIGKTLERARDRDQEPVIIYLGDHDPSGIDMTRDVTERLAMFSWDDVRVERIALNMDQVKELNPPENPAKVTDSRYAAYRRRFGDSSWELDAIEPRALAALVRTAIEDEIDFRAWRTAKLKQAGMKEELQVMARTYREEHS